MGTSKFINTRTIGNYVVLTIVFIVILVPVFKLLGATPVNRYYKKLDTSTGNGGFLWMSYEKAYAELIGRAQ